MNIKCLPFLLSMTFVFCFAGDFSDDSWEIISQASMSSEASDTIVLDMPDCDHPIFEDAVRVRSVIPEHFADDVLVPVCAERESLVTQSMVEKQQCMLHQKVSFQKKIAQCGMKVFCSCIAGSMFLTYLITQ